MKKYLRWLAVPVLIGLLVTGVLTGAGPQLRKADAAVTLHQPLRIMAMGDSITQGFVSSSNDSPVGSWRHWFWQDRGTLGCGQIDMVGDRNTLFDGTSLPAGDDQDHQALAGYRMDQLYWDVNGGAVRRNLPDVVLLLAGTNDLYYYNTPDEQPAEVANDLDMVVTAARKDKADIVFFVMGINPRGNDPAPIVATNDLYRSYVASHSTAQSPMIYVDGFNGFDAAKDTFDWVHPNLSGQHKISDRFHSALATYCAGSAPVNTTTTTQPTTTATQPTTTTTRPTTTTTRPTTTTTAGGTTTTTTVAKPIRYEAELAAVASGVDTNDTMWCPCSGGRAVGGFRDPGQFVDWSVSVPKAGNYKLTWRYGAGGTSTNRELRINATTVNASLGFPSTGTWSNWQTLSVTVALTAGTNHVRLTSTTWASADYLNLDYLDVG